MLQVFNLTRQQSVATSARLAKSLWSRLCGLLLSKPLSEGEGLYLLPCNSIHMFGMRFAIDAIFVDKSGRVVGIENDIQPWQLSKLYWKAHGCLELPVGTISDTNTVIGDQLTFKESP